MRPDARIALNAYPYVDSETPIYTLGTYPVSQKMRQLGAAGDAAEQRAVDLDNADAGTEHTVFVPDIKTCFAGHEPYGSWDDQNPDRWIWEFERGPYNADHFFEGDRNDIYHPTPTGHTEWANCLHPYGSFGTAGSRTGGDVDVVFVVDTTGSMFDDIGAVKTFATQFVDLLQTSTSSYRVCAGHLSRLAAVDRRPERLPVASRSRLHGRQDLDRLGDQRDVGRRRRRLPGVRVFRADAEASASTGAPASRRSWSNSATRPRTIRSRSADTRS